MSLLAYYGAIATDLGSIGGGTLPATGEYYGADYRPNAPVPLRTVSATPGTFASAIANAQPGDRIELANGSYGEWNILGSGLNGTATNPIVITPASGATVTFTEIDIRENCSHVWFGEFRNQSQHINFSIDGGGSGGGGGACLRVGWDQQRTGTYAHASVNNLKFCGIHMTHISYNPCVIKGAATDIDILNCKFSQGGLLAPWFGEHIYIGQANPATYPSANERILIQGNLFVNATADVIDIKNSNIQGIQVLDNYFEMATFDGTGSGFTIAAVAVQGLVLSTQTRDPQIKILRNVFRDISETGTDALARPLTAYMPCEFAYNVMFRIGREAVRCNAPSSVPGWWTTALKWDLHHNTAFDTDEDINGVDAFTFSGFDTTSAARLRVVSNVLDTTISTPTGTAEESDNHVATSSDFIGPLTGSANAGPHVGSGYKLDNASSIPATAGALGKN